MIYQEGQAISRMSIGMVDDHIEYYDNISEELSNAGYTVNVFSTIEEATEFDGFDSILNWVVDKRFGKLATGVQLFNKLRAERNKRVVMVTQYASNKDTLGHVTYDEKLNNASAIISKPGSLSARDQQMSQFFSSFFSSNEIPEEIRLEEYGVRSEYEEYIDLSESAQDEVFEGVLESHRDLISAEWSKGAVWICIFGKNATEVKAEYSTDRIPSADEVDAMGESKGLIPFVLDRSLAFHNTNCSATDNAGGAHVHTYPHVSLSGLSGDDEVGFHFDTGADTSLFCSEFVNGLNPNVVEKRSKSPRSILIQNQPHIVRDIRITALVKLWDPSGENGVSEENLGSKAIQFEGLSVAKWGKSNLVVKCSNSCKNGTVGTFCKFRENGLVGRTFYQAGDFDVLLSSGTTRVGIIGKGHRG